MFLILIILRKKIEEYIIVFEKFVKNGFRKQVMQLF